MFIKKIFSIMENNNKPYDQVRDKAQNLKENIHDKADRIVDKTVDKVNGAFDSTKQKVNDLKSEGQKSYDKQENWKETPHDPSQNWKQDKSYDQNDYTKKQSEAGQYGKASKTSNYDKTNGIK